MTRYYVYDGESYDASYTTPEEARKAAIRALDGWRNDAETNDGWADEAAPVAWGEVREIATIIEHAGAVEEDGLDDRGVDYELRAPDEDMVRAALTTPEAYVGAVSEAVAEELERVRAHLAATRKDRDEARRERDDARARVESEHQGCNRFAEAMRAEIKAVKAERDEWRRFADTAHDILAPFANDAADDLHGRCRRAVAALAGSKS